MVAFVSSSPFDWLTTLLVSMAFETICESRLVYVVEVVTGGWGQYPGS